MRHQECASTIRPKVDPVARRMASTVATSASGPAAGRILYAGKPIAFTAAASAA